MYTILLLAGLALPNVCLTPPMAAPSAAHTLQFQVAERTHMRKTFRVRESALSTDFRVFMGGQPVPSQFLPQLEFASENSITVEVRDTYEGFKEGQLQEFVREYNSLEGEGSFTVTVPPDEPEESDWQRESLLAGESVAFVWDPKTESFGRTLNGGGKCPVPLKDLQAQADLTEFLTDEEVDVGDSWTVEASVLAGLFDPGGRLELGEDEDDGEESFEPLAMEGELTVRMNKVESEDGVTIATLTIEGEFVRTAERAGDLSRVPVADGLATDVATWNYELQGELLWNLDASHAISLDISATFGHMLRTDRDPDQGGADYASEIESEGELEIHVEFSPVEAGRD